MIDNINELAAEAHENAVIHGFYDVPDPEECNIAMLHCELSEAVQAERNDEGLRRYICKDWDGGGENECTMKGRNTYAEYCARYPMDALLSNGKTCSYRKAEGVAVELADFVIRLMDYAAGHGMKIPTRQQIVPTYSSLPRLVNRLHSSINELVHFRDIDAGFGFKDGTGCVAQVCIIANAVELVETFLDAQDIDLWEVVREKMAYNRNRPMLHGKKY